MSKFISKFKVPEVAINLINEIFLPEEIKLVEALDNESFTISDLKIAFLEKYKEEWLEENIKLLLEKSYKRGIINLIDENFREFKLNTFYTRLDIFAMTEPDKYLAFPKETRKAIDSWYFNEYINGLGNEERPSEDRVGTMQEALDYIDSVDKPIWLNRCDCRTLAGNCDKPTDTCISFRNGINTTSHRGWSKPLTKEEAKDVIKRANKAGLMQTINPNCICNCCTDCCYLFRAQKHRNSQGVWPKSDRIVEFTKDSCITCGLCIDRCHFNAFYENEGEINYKADLCRGCGLCVETCPTSSIALIGRR